MIAQPLITPPATLTRRQIALVAASILVVYLLLSVGTLLTARPQTDESIYANPGYNLLYNGRMSTTLYELRGFMPLSMAERTYWQPPVYFLTTAAWYRVLGFGLFQVRVLSLLFGLLALYAWYAIGRRLSGSPVLGLTISGLVSIDYFFVLGASQGRMDVMCASLGVAAMAVYLSLRERSLARALFWSHVVATASVLTHPVGLSYWLGLALLVLYFDRRSLSVRLVALAAAPCLAGGLAWGAYIAQDPTEFLAQMHGILEMNKHAFETPGQSRIGFIRNLQQEVLYRYVGPFGLGPGVGMVQRLKGFVLLAYVTGIVGMLVLSRRKGQRALVILPAMTLMAVLYLALASPSKFSYYLPHTTMLMAACLASFLFYVELPRARKVMAAAVVMAAIGLIEAGGLVYRMRQDPYHRSYLPAVEAITRNSAPGTMVIGSGELWFRLQPARAVLHDPALGYRNGIKPAIFAMDPLYYSLHEHDRQEGSPIWLWVEQYLAESRVVYEDGYYRVFVR